MPTQTHRRWQSCWRSEAVTRVAAAAARSGLRPVDLRPFALSGVAGLVVACGLLAVSARAADDPTVNTKDRIVHQEISGEVVATTSRTLSLEIGRTATTSEEMLLPVDPATVELDRITSFADLQRGDRVHVQYRQTFQDTDGGESRLVGTVATKISLLDRAIGGQRLRSVEGGGL